MTVSGDGALTRDSTTGKDRGVDRHQIAEEVPRGCGRGRQRHGQRHLHDASQARDRGPHARRHRQALRRPRRARLRAERRQWHRGRLWARQGRGRPRRDRPHHRRRHERRRTEPASTPQRSSIRVHITPRRLCPEPAVPEAAKAEGDGPSAVDELVSLLSEIEPADAELDAATIDEPLDEPDSPEEDDEAPRPAAGARARDQRPQHQHARHPRARHLWTRHLPGAPQDLPGSRARRRLRRLHLLPVQPRGRPHRCHPGRLRQLRRHRHQPGRLHPYLDRHPRRGQGGGAAHGRGAHLQARRARGLPPGLLHPRRLLRDHHRARAGRATARRCTTSPSTSASRPDKA